MSDRERLAIVVAAAGSGRRFGADKMSERLGDRTVLETTIDAIQAAVPSAPVVVVVRSERLEDWRTVLKSTSPKTTVTAGGERRQDSVRIGVEKAAELGAEIVAVHDGARPLIHPDDVIAVLDALGDDSGAILCTEVSDTVKRVGGDGAVLDTVLRGSLRLAQTPQVFRVAALKAAWRRQDPSLEWSDEAALLEAVGGRIQTVISDHPNPKLTAPGDLEMMKLMIGGNT